MNVILVSIGCAFLYGWLSKSYLRGQAMLATLPFAILISMVAIKFAGPVAFFIVKFVLFLLVKFKIIIAKYLSTVIGGLLVNIIPGIGQIVSILIFIVLMLLMMGVVVEFYLWILTLFSSALAFVRRISDAISTSLSSVGSRQIGILASLLFEVGLIAYPTFVGFRELVDWLSSPSNSALSSAVVLLSGIVVAATTLASYRRNTANGRLPSADYFDPRDVIETYL